MPKLFTAIKKYFSKKTKIASELGEEINEDITINREPLSTVRKPISTTGTPPNLLDGIETEPDNKLNISATTSITDPNTELLPSANPIVSSDNSTKIHSGASMSTDIHSTDSYDGTITTSERILNRDSSFRPISKGLFKSSSKGSFKRVKSLHKKSSLLLRKENQDNSYIGVHTIIEGEFEDKTPKGSPRSSENNLSVNRRDFLNISEKTQEDVTFNPIHEIDSNSSVIGIKIGPTAKLAPTLANVPPLIAIDNFASKTNPLLTEGNLKETFILLEEAMRYESANTGIINALKETGFITEKNILTYRFKARFQDALRNNDINDIEKLLGDDIFRLYIDSRETCSLNAFTTEILKDHNGRNPIHWLVESLESLEYKTHDHDKFIPKIRETLDLLIRHHFKAELRDKFGMTPLYLLCRSYGTYDVYIAEELIKRGAQVNKINFKTGFTPLHEAARSENFNLLTKLIEKGGDLNIEAHNFGKKTPMQILQKTSDRHNLMFSEFLNAGSENSFRNIDSTHAPENQTPRKRTLRGGIEIQKLP